MQMDVRVEYTVFFAVLDSGPPDTGVLIPPNLLVRPLGRSAATVTAGLDTGVVDVTIETLSSQPKQTPDELLSQREIVQEVALDSSGEIMMYELMGGKVDDSLPCPPGPVIVRVAARGRDIDRQGFVDRSEEGFLIQIWPEVTATPLLRVGKDGLSAERDATFRDPPMASDLPVSCPGCS